VLNKISINIANQFGSENYLKCRVLKFTIRWREMAGLSVNLAPPTSNPGNGIRFPQLRKLAGTWGDGEEKNSWQPEHSERIHSLEVASCCWRRNELTESITLFALPWEFLPTENGGIHSKKRIFLNLSLSVTDWVILLLVYVAETTHLTILNCFVFSHVPS